MSSYKCGQPEVRLQRLERLERRQRRQRVGHRQLVTFAVDPGAGSKSFFTAYSNPTVVKDTHAAEQTLTTSARQSLYNAIQNDAAADAFMVFFYYSPYAYAASSGVRNFFVTPLGNYHLENVWLSK